MSVCADSTGDIKAGGKIGGSVCLGSLAERRKLSRCRFFLGRRVCDCFFAGKHITHCALRGYMDQLRQVGSFLAKMPDIIRVLLPWDVGQSQWQLWGSIALFVVVVTILGLGFGWLCGWIVARSLRPR